MNVDFLIGQYKAACADGETCLGVTTTDLRDLLAARIAVETLAKDLVAWGHEPASKSACKAICLRLTTLVQKSGVVISSPCHPDTAVWVKKTGVVVLDQSEEGVSLDDVFGNTEEV